MKQEQRGRMQGASTGYHGGAVFRLTNGQVWQQSRYLYRYRYAYRPEVLLFQEASRQKLQIAGMDDAVEVKRVEVACDGSIVSDFTGFNADALFEFQNGQVWVPAEYKYNYHYAFHPAAMVVNGVSGCTLHVDGMSESLVVRRAR